MPDFFINDLAEAKKKSEKFVDWYNHVNTFLLAMHLSVNWFPNNWLYSILVPTHWLFYIEIIDWLIYLFMYSFTLTVSKNYEIIYEVYCSLNRSLNTPAAVEIPNAYKYI